MSTGSKLAVVLHADVVGSTALVHADERVAHDRMQQAFRHLSKSVSEFGGTTHELRGDALVAEFGRASDAVCAALAFQAANAEHNTALTDGIRPELRIGISMGEVVIADGTLTGPDVVLAQRLEQLARPGGVCISAAARTTIPRRLPFVFEDLGEQLVKGFDDPVGVCAVSVSPAAALPEPETDPEGARSEGSRARRWVAAAIAAGIVGFVAVIAWPPASEPGDGATPIATTPPASAPIAAPPGEENPSIAVLPFQNLSGEEGQEYFSDGITNDIITDLSKFSNMLVIASNSVFTYKGRPVDVKTVGEELGVRYVLEGSVQKSGGRVRINAQLIDATTNHHIWADRYDFAFDDIFRVQDEITGTVISSLQVILTEEEQSRGSGRHTAVPEAYDLYLRGRTYLKGTRKAHAKARELFDEAIALDPGFAAAHAEKSLTFFSSFIMPMSRNPKVIEASLAAAERAVALDDRLPLAHARLAWAYFATRQHAKAVASARRAVALGPNDAEAHAQLGNVLNWSGKPEEGKRYVERAMRLNPYYPFYYLFYLGHSHYLLENNEKAIELMNRVVTRAPNFLPVRRHLAVMLAEAGRKKEAADQTAEILRVFPGASIQDERARCFYRWTPKLMNRFFTGLRQSGMPEGKIGEEPMSM